MKLGRRQRAAGVRDYRPAPLGTQARDGTLVGLGGFLPGAQLGLEREGQVEQGVLAGTKLFGGLAEHRQPLAQIRQGKLAHGGLTVADVHYGAAPRGLELGRRLREHGPEIRGSAALHGGKANGSGSA